MKRRVTRQHLRRPRALLLIGLSVLLIVWLIWSGLFAQPSKRDYQKALERLKALQTAQGRLDTASSEYVQAIVASLRLTLDGSNVAEDSKVSADTYRQELRSYESATNRLQASRVARDGEVKPVLGEVSDHSDALVRSIKSITQDYDELYRAYVACDPVVRFNTNGPVDATGYETTSKPCLAELDELSKVSTVEFAGYAKKATEQIDKKRQLYKANAALPDLQAVDVRLMMLDPIARMQTLKQELFATTKLDSLQALLERKRDA